MRNTNRFRHPFGIENILTGTACLFALYRFAVIVKLQRNADDVIAFFG